jgi:hypothetical protein
MFWKDCINRSHQTILAIDIDERVNQETEIRPWSARRILYHQQLERTFILRPQ